MERTTDTLSTRDLASPNEQARDVAPPEGDVRDATPPEGDVRDATPPEAESGRNDQAAPVDDQAAPAQERGGSTVDEERALPADEQTGAPARPSTDAAASASDPGGSLLPADTDATFQERWKEIQTRFVDEPRGAVEDADGLVANLMQQLAEGFAAERERLEAQWGRGEDISTEDLRVALQRYRSFFQRLLST
jgi:hypothetical protein